MADSGVLTLPCSCSACLDFKSYSPILTLTDQKRRPLGCNGGKKLLLRAACKKTANVAAAKEISTDAAEAAVLLERMAFSH